MYNFTNLIYRNGILVRHNPSPKYNLKLLFDTYSLHNMTVKKNVYKDYIEHEECLTKLNKRNLKEKINLKKEINL